jgi:FKBP-type peptidyl-prolyl cis-trans isomerase FkpA
MKRVWTGVMAMALGVTLVATGCQAEAPAKAAEPQAPQTEDAKTLYAMGLLVGRNLTTFELTPDELVMLKRGLEAAATGAKPEVDLATYGPKVQEFAQARALKVAAVAAEKGKAFAEAAAKEAGAVKTDSGLVYVELTKGTGASPTAKDTVKVNYKGTLTDGTEFDSSYKRGQPAEFPLGNVIPCWTEGVQKMAIGGKAKLVCPSTIAYGERGHPPSIPGGATLVFELELLEIKAAAAAPAAPAAKAPAPAASPVH